MTRACFFFLHVRRCRFKVTAADPMEFSVVCGTVFMVGGTEGVRVFFLLPFHINFRKEEGGGREVFSSCAKKKSKKAKK